MRRVKDKRSASSIVGCAPRCAEPHAETPEGVLTATIQRRQTVAEIDLETKARALAARAITDRVRRHTWRQQPDAVREIMPEFSRAQSAGRRQSRSLRP